MLEKAKTLVWQREAIHDQQQFLKLSSDVSSVRAVKSTQKTSRRPNQRNSNNRRPQQTTEGPKQCSHCGKSAHSHEVCPAKDVTCRKCKKKGHFSVMCYTKPVQNVTESDTMDTFYLNTVDNSPDSKSWTMQISVNQVDLLFKLDTEAEVTAITEKAYQALGSPKTTQPVKKLCGPTSKSLKVIGRLTVSMTYKDHSCEQDIFVVNHLHHNLLGLPAIKALHLLTRVEPITTMNIIQQEFPNLFTGLGMRVHLKEIPIQFVSSLMQNLFLWEQPEIFHYLFETKFKRHSTKLKHKGSSLKYISPLHGVLAWLW